MMEVTMNGIRRGNEALYITHFPGLKKPVLAIGRGCSLQKISSFDSEEDAEEFCQILYKWIGLN